MNPSELRSLIPPHWSDAPDRRKIPIEQIIVEDSVNPRSMLDDAVIDELVGTLSAGVSLPPLSVFQMKEGLVLADGHHRLSAHQRHGSTEVEVERHHGPLREAKLFALYSNTRHGRQLSRNEVRYAIRKWLDDREFHMRSNVEIAQLCHCSPPTVAKVRKEHPLTAELSSDIHRVVKRGGRHVQMRTANIGRRTTVPIERRREAEDEPELFAEAVAPPKARSNTRTNGAEKAAHFLGRLEALISEWEEPARLARALMPKGRDQTLRQRFGESSRWFDRVKLHFISERRAKTQKGRRTIKK